MIHGQLSNSCPQGISPSETGKYRCKIGQSSSTKIPSRGYSSKPVTHNLHHPIISPNFFFPYSHNFLAVTVGNDFCRIQVICYGGCRIREDQKYITPHRAISERRGKHFFVNHLPGISIQSRHHLILRHGREVVNIKSLSCQIRSNVLRYQPMVELRGY
jgi:hypothetical protein